MESKDTKVERKAAYHDVENSEGEGIVTWFIRKIIVLFSFIISMIPIFWPFCIYVVYDYQRAVHFRLGKLNGAAKGPGVFFFLLFVDEVRIVDLRIQELDVPTQEMITKDSVTCKVNAVVFVRVVDPNKCVIKIQDYLTNTGFIAQTTLRAVVGNSELDDLLSKRDKINAQLEKIVDEATDEWGVKVFGIEVKDVTLPVKMQRAMASQAESERLRRAKVISAEGEVQASKLLQAAAKTMQTEPLSIQLRYLQTLTTVSAEKNSTIVFPVPVDAMPLLNKKLK